jgi:hypothetical protein
VNSNFRRARVVAVVSDGAADNSTRNARTSDSTLGSTLDVTLRRYAAGIHDLAGLPTRAIRLRADTGIQDFQERLRRGPSDIAAVILIRTDPARARAAQAASVGLPVITDLDATAITVSAAVLTTLTRAGRTPASARVVIAGANSVPVLCPLLVAAGIGDITTWNVDDAVSFPLLGVAANADVVINLLADRSEIPALPVLCAAHTDPMVITPNPRHDPLLVLPGLTRALVNTPSVSWSPAATDNYYTETCLASALTLVMATPPQHTLPTQAQRQLTDRIAEAATHALRPEPHAPTKRSDLPRR